MIKVATDIRGALRQLQNAAKQTTYATAVALTRTAQAVQAASPAALEKALKRPTPFTTRGMFIIRATKQTLTSVVGFKDIQSKYLMYQFAGGTRRPTKKALRLPSKVDLNQYGNLKRGEIQKLVAQSKRKGSAIFYGQPSPSLPAGLWRRVGSTLEPVIMFPARSAHYKKRFDWFAFARKTALAAFPAQFERAIADAMRTAR